ncbi:MAG: hypothetical protein M1379_01425 [Firmicutes bacterium]|nr:hypothetical protein [Bacillota bacterium]
MPDKRVPRRKEGGEYRQSVIRDGNGRICCNSGNRGVPHDQLRQPVLGDPASDLSLSGRGI